MSVQPRSLDDFMRWSTVDTCGVFGSHTKNWYETTQNNLYLRVIESEFVKSVEDMLASFAESYRLKTSASLFAFERLPELKWNKKSYGSFVEKMYRINCIENDKFPSPPDKGWTSLSTAFRHIDDIVRTTFVVGYADAPSFLAERLASLADELGVRKRVKDHAKEKGYYAHHVYFGVEIPIASTSGSFEFSDTSVEVEIQLTTELQGALREITHKLYEQERLDGGLAEDWKHRFDSGRFRAAYMAHSLRFIEAMIVDLRNSIKH